MQPVQDLTTLPGRRIGNGTLQITNMCKSEVEVVVVVVHLLRQVVVVENDDGIKIDEMSGIRRLVVSRKMIM